MITPSPQVDKTFDPPLAARPIPIRTGSLSRAPSPSPARRHASANRLRKATSMLGMRSLQNITHLRSFTTPQKAIDRSESNSGSSTGSRSVASRKRVRDRPLRIGMPFVDDEIFNAVLKNPIVPIKMDRADETPFISLPVPGPRFSTVCSQFLDINEVDKHQAPTLTPSVETSSPKSIDSSSRDAPSSQDTSRTSTETSYAVDSSIKRVADVQFWDVSLDIDLDALHDALEEHPSPLNSNPPSAHDDKQPTTPWTTLTSTKDNLDGNSAIGSYWQDSSSPSPSPAPESRPRSMTFAASSIHVPSESIFTPSSLCPENDRPPSTQPRASGTVLRLHRELANLCAGNNALLALKTAHEETIALLRDNLGSQEVTISRQENTIADLTWQVQAKETEQSSNIEDFCAEIGRQNRDIAQLGEDKWYLMGRVEELESKVTTMGKPSSAEPESQKTVDGLMSIVADHMGTEDFRDDACGEKSTGLAGSCQSTTNSPEFDPSASINYDTGTPVTMFSSLFSPRPRSSSSNQSLYAATPEPSVCKAPSIRVSRYDNQECCVVPGRRCDSKHSMQINAFGVSDGLSTAEQHNRYSQVSSMTTTSVVPVATTRLVQRLASTQGKLATSEANSLVLQAQVAQQATLIQQLTCTSSGPTSMLSAHIPIPDLPVLTYTRSGAVWLDRVTSSFAYLGLLDFIQRDVPRPQMSTWDATEVTDWTSRRLRAVVLLKHAVDDDVLEDVLHLLGKREAPGERDFVQSTSAMEDPHQLLTTILTLRRIISATATDLSWLDRIGCADFDGIETFTSLVLCVDKRHGVMYGTSADHYDALLPKLQETMARLFPELKGPMFSEDGDGGLPRKWRQLSIWMAKVVKRRQISGDS